MAKQIARIQIVFIFLARDTSVCVGTNRALVVPSSYRCAGQSVDNVCVDTHTHVNTQPKWNIITILSFKKKTGKIDRPSTVYSFPLKDIVVNYIYTKIKKLNTQTYFFEI